MIQFPQACLDVFVYVCVRVCKPARVHFCIVIYLHTTDSIVEIYFPPECYKKTFFLRSSSSSIFNSLPSLQATSSSPADVIHGLPLGWTLGFPLYTGWGSLRGRSRSVEAEELFVGSGLPGTTEQGVLEHNTQLTVPTVHRVSWLSALEGLRCRYKRHTNVWGSCETCAL